MALIARFFYPGLPPSVVQHAVYSIGHGLEPGVITVEVPANTAYPQLQGDAVFAFGGTTITIQGCKFDAGTSRMAPSDQVWSFAIQDGRWIYEFGEISGHYNLRKPDNSILKETEKTPQELAELCLKAMNVQNYDISAMDETRRPEIDWDYDNPGEALEELADEVGCRVVWWVDGSIQILPLGFGANLPNFPATSLDFNFNAAAMPKSVKILGAPTKFQARWQLVAVGLDTDTVWKPIDSLSYKPPRGWGKEAPDMLGSLRQSPLPPFQMPTAKQQIYDLAIRSVFKSYRISYLLGSEKLPGIDPKDDPFDMTKLNAPPPPPDANGYSPDPRNYWKHCLPLGDGLIALESNDTEGGERRPYPAIVRGDFYYKPLSGNQTQFRYKDSFSVDAQHGIVQFSEAVWLMADSNRVDNAPANLSLEITFNVRDKNWAFVRPVWEFTLNASSPAGSKIVKTDEIQYTVLQNYDTDNSIIDTKDNRKKFQLDEDAAELANVYIGSLQTVTGGDRTYPGVYSVRTDGALTQVTWSVGRGIPTTRVSRNTQHDTDIIPTYLDARRRRREAAQREIIKTSKRALFEAHWTMAENGKSA